MREVPQLACLNNGAFDTSFYARRFTVPSHSLPNRYYRHSLAGRLSLIFILNHSPGGVLFAQPQSFLNRLYLYSNSAVSRGFESSI